MLQYDIDMGSRRAAVWIAFEAFLNYADGTPRAVYEAFVKDAPQWAALAQIFIGRYFLGSKQDHGFVLSGTARMPLCAKWMMQVAKSLSVDFRKDLACVASREGYSDVTQEFYPLFTAGHAHTQSLLGHIVYGNNASVMEEALQRFSPGKTKATSLLRIAIRQFKNNSANALLEYGVDFTCPPAHQMDLVAEACVANNTEALELLFAHGATYQTTRGECIRIAVRKNSVRVLELLLVNGLTVDMIKNSAMASAAAFGNTEMVLFLYDLGISLDEPGVVYQEFAGLSPGLKCWGTRFIRPLKAAITAGHAETTKMLVTLGACCAGDVMEGLSDEDQELLISLLRKRERCE